MPTVLIVEDQEPMRRQLRDFVQLAHPELFIAEAADGMAALVACAAHRPAVVLMDIELPDLNGISLTGHIGARFPEARVIVVSQHAARVYLERAQSAGAFAYIPKDKVSTDLLPVLERALAAAPKGSAP